MEAGFLIKIFEFFKNIPQKILWALLLFPFGIEFLTFNDAFNHFLNEYSFIKSITWLISLFSLLCLIFTYIEIVINCSKQIKSERKKQAEQAVLDYKRKEAEELKKIEEKTKVSIEKKRKADQVLGEILNLSNQAKAYLLIDFFNDHREEQWISTDNNREKHICYFYELIEKGLILRLQVRNSLRSGSRDMLCRISPKTIEFLKDELRFKKIYDSLPDEYKEEVKIEICPIHEYYDLISTKTSP